MKSPLTATNNQIASLISQARGEQCAYHATNGNYEADIIDLLVKLNEADDLEERMQVAEDLVDVAGALRDLIDDEYARAPQRNVISC